RRTRPGNPGVECAIPPVEADSFSMSAQCRKCEQMGGCTPVGVEPNSVPIGTIVTTGPAEQTRRRPAPPRVDRSWGRHDPTCGRHSCLPYLFRAISANAILRIHGFTRVPKSQC